MHMRKRVLSGLMALGLFSFGLGFLGKYHWLLDLFAHFRVYYLFYFLVLGVAALLCKHRQMAYGSVILSLFIASTLAKFYWPQPEAITQGGLKVCAINLLSSNQNHEAVIRFVQESNFDIVLFQELNDGWTDALDTLSSDYPYGEHSIRRDNFGIGILSKLPLEDIQFLTFTQIDIPILLISVNYQGKALQIIGTHTLPPVGTAQFEARNKQFRNLIQWVSRTEQEVLLIGDLNCTSFSPNFDELVQGTQLRDTRLGFGLLPSWNAKLFFIALTIDHALVSAGIEVKHRSTGPFIGSDHLPIMLDIIWKE